MDTTASRCSGSRVVTGAPANWRERIARRVAALCGVLFKDQADRDVVKLDNATLEVLGDLRRLRYGG